MSPSRSLTAQLLHELQRVLDRRGVRWYVFGAQAVIVHGRPRLTADVDVTIEIPVGGVDELIRELRAAGFALRITEEVEDFIAQTRVLPFLHEPTSIPLDVVLAGPGLEELFMAEAERTEVGGALVPVMRAEHVVVTKILAGRPKDLEDALGICIEKGPRLNVEEIRNLLGSVEQALDQSDLTPEFEKVLAHAR